MSMAGYLIPQSDEHRTQMPGYQPLESNLPLDPPFQHQPQECPGPEPQNIVPFMPEIPGVPPGLEYLTQINQIHLQQKSVYSPQNINHYEIQNNMGQRIYTAKEQKEFCGNLYHMKIMDNFEREVIQLLEIYKCFTSQREVEIQSPPGRTLGYITYAWQAFVTSLSILDTSKEPVLMVVGPGFQTNLFGDVNFEVKTKDKSQTVGKITKDSELFLVQIPWDLDVQMKVILMGAALFLVCAPLNFPLLILLCYDRVLFGLMKASFLTVVITETLNYATYYIRIVQANGMIKTTARFKILASTSKTRH